MLKFSKQKMLDRIKSEGREDLIDDKVKQIMDNLDGQMTNPHCWQRVVNDEPVYYVVGKDGTGNYVNEKDCVEE